MFMEDNSSVYYKLEEATRATSYVASIKPYQRTKMAADVLKYEEILKVN